MIPKIIHYIWLGGKEKPELVQRCIASWHQFMPDWQYMEWNEDTIDAYCAKHNLPSPISNLPYCSEAYAARKFAFVSDYIRLWVLNQFGGLYMDVDFEVYRSFEDLLDCSEGAFVGREGSKHQPPMLGVMAAEAHSPWIEAMMDTYAARKFMIGDDSSEDAYDMTTNVSYFAAAGVHKPEWVRIYPVDYFCPVLTTGERVHSVNTYCEHKGLHSWGKSGGMKAKILNLFGPKTRTCIIKLKRKLLG